jgi:hypothetical protein
MKTAFAKDKLGLVLEMKPMSAVGDQSPLSAHLILNRCLIDDDGNICVTAPEGLLGVLDLIDLLKSELDGLANEAVLWFAQNIALRRTRLHLISNDYGEWVAGDPTGDGARNSVGIPPPLQFWTLCKLTRNHE